MNLPTLYKLDNSGKVRQWRTWVDGNEYFVEHGAVGGALQTTSTECFGKNQGRANETTDEEQAELEAKSQWDKQKNRKGYGLDKNPSKKFGPMLAQRYDQHGKKINFPAIIQTKIDGCVSGDTLIKTKEYGVIPIKKIVEEKLECKVQSFNNQTNKLEYKSVKNYFKNRHVKNVIWYELELSSGEKVRLTGNHRVFLPDYNCWRRVDKLLGNENLMLNYKKNS